MATHIKHAITLNCKGRHKHHILKWLSTHGYSHQTCSKDIRSKDPAFRLFAALLLPKLLTFESLPMPVPNCIARLTLAAALGRPSLLNACPEQQLVSLSWRILQICYKPQRKLQDSMDVLLIQERVSGLPAT